MHACTHNHIHTHAHTPHTHMHTHTLMNMYMYIHLCSKIPEGSSVVRVGSFVAEGTPLREDFQGMKYVMSLSVGREGEEGGGGREGEVGEERGWRGEERGG